MKRTNNFPKNKPSIVQKLEQLVRSIFKKQACAEKTPQRCGTFPLHTRELEEKMGYKPDVIED